MAGIVDGVKTFNSAARTILLTIAVGLFGYAAYFGYSEYTARDRQLKDQQEKIKAANAQLVSLQGELESKDEAIAQLDRDLKLTEEQVERLQTSVQLLKTDARLAQLRVIDIRRNDEGNVVESDLEFVELSPQGDPIATPKQFTLPGDVVYIDNWIVKFDDEYIERGDVIRGTSLCLFRRVFSEKQMPSEGVSLDEIGMRPQAYARGGSVSEFEQELWRDFWEFANDRELAESRGIRAAHGEAVSINVREGQTYSIELRASGGLSIQPIAQ